MSDSLRKNDATELAALLTECFPHHPISERRARRKLFGDSGLDPALVRCVRGPGGRIESAVAVERLADEEGRKRARLMFVATRSDRRRQGLARALYAEVETELRMRGIHDVVYDTGMIPSGLDLRYEAVTTMLLRRLYVTTSVGYDMTFDPDRPIPDPGATPPGWRVRELTSADAPALDALCAREFTGWTWASRLIRLGESCGVMGAFDAQGSLGAFTGFDEYILGPVGTDPAHRRHGLGSIVFLHAAHRAAKLVPGCPLLIGRANIMYYARAFGCHIRGTIWHMKKDLTADPAISKGKQDKERGNPRNTRKSPKGKSRGKNLNRR